MGMQQESTRKGSNIIRAYASGEIRIMAETYTHSLVISADKLVTDWTLTDIKMLDDSLITTILEQDPELILLGTGDTFIFPSAEKLHLIIDGGIGYEIMDTAAACRTYNVLIAEARHVVAGLII